MLVKRTLVGFGASPSVFAVLVVGNGCEDLQPKEIAKAIVPGGKRVEAITVQEMKGMVGTEGDRIGTGHPREGNPSPGNIAGGIATLEEKSLGCIYKAGSSLIQEVIAYACKASRKGLVYMDTPAHDIEQLTAMVVGGAQIVTFTTGR